MSLFAKTGPWVAATLMTAASIFGQNSRCAPAQKSFEQGHEMMQSQMMAGYNAPSRIEVRGSWDVYASGSFTYWQPIQENMELGVVNDLSLQATTHPEYRENGNVVNCHFKYQPGFKVGLGMNFDHDNWDTFVEYTWFRGAQSTTTSLDAATPAVNLLAFWIIDDSNIGFAYLNGTQKWRLHMDLLDWELARSHYVGTKLTFRPFFAARAAWIRQNLDVNYTNGVTYGDTITYTGDSASVIHRSHSWAVGPRLGLYTNWLIGDGFRLYGNGAGDILFTQYTKLFFNESVLAASGAPSRTYLIKQHDINYLRSHLELELGFGWGSYFDNNNWHVDLSAGYTFQVFYDQNMFRRSTADGPTDIGPSFSPDGNLFMHGLTATARFDF